MKPFIHPVQFGFYPNLFPNVLDNLKRYCAKYDLATEADVRDFSYAMDCAYIIVRLWNHRKIYISEFDLFRDRNSMAE